MKRDMELVRKILINLESDEEAGSLVGNEYTEQQVGYHCWLIIDAGLAEGSDVSCNDGLGSQGLLYGLNWAGHEFLDASRDPKRWSRAMEMVKEAGGAVTFAGIKALLTVLMEQAIGVGPGPH